MNFSNCIAIIKEMTVNRLMSYLKKTYASLGIISLILMSIPSLCTQKNTWITVFVHGIMSIKPHLTIGNFMHFMRDDVEDTIYSKTVEIMRNDEYFYLNQAMQGFGLKKIDIYDIRKETSANATARIYNEMKQLAGGPDVDNHYYTFGWSGLLGPTVRYKAAEKLFNALVNELEIYWQQGIYPKVQLIGYSHGANVCLNLAAIRQDKFPLSPLAIDELILLGCPVQTETDFLVVDDIFKKIYHVYSTADRIQRIDFFSFNRIFSRRYFKNRHGFKVPSKLMQIQLKFVRNTRSKRYNHEKRYQYAHNFNSPSIISGKSPFLRDISPGHIEFWFFGWSPKNYRENFIINPLPAFVVLPYALHHIKQVENSLKNPYPVIIDIRPEHETMLIKQRKHNKFTKIVPFVSQADLERLNSIAYQVQPDQYDNEEYNNHIYSAMRKAKKIIYYPRKNNNDKFESRHTRARMRKRKLRH